MNCSCFGDLNRALKPKGFQLSDKLSRFRVTGELGLEHTLGFPIERIDGRRLSSKDAKTVEMSHCPFCGAKISDEEDSAKTIQGEQQPS